MELRKRHAAVRTSLSAVSILCHLEPDVTVSVIRLS
jgi:hypothetical protein